MFRSLLLLFVFCFFALAAKSQKGRLDSLLSILPQAKDTSRAAVYNELSSIYIENDLKECIRYANLLLQWADSANHLSYKADATGWLGEAYFYQDNFDLSLQYFEMYLDIRIEQGDEENIASAYNNLGIVTSYVDNHKKALTYYERALEISERIKDYELTSNLLNNIGVIYENHIKDYSKALEYYKKSLQYEYGVNHTKGIVISLNNIGDLYRKWGKNPEAADYYRKGIELADSAGLLFNVVESYADFYKLYADEANYKEAFQYLQKYTMLKDSLFNIESQKQISELEIQYQSAQKENQIKLQKERIKNQRTTIIGALIGIMIILVSLILLFRENIKRRRLNNVLREQKEEIYDKALRLKQANKEVAKRNKEIVNKNNAIEEHIIEITQKNDIIEEKNRSITDSIAYAKRIQSALLLPPAEFKTAFTDHFILYAPKDIVSGDFYWVRKTKNKVWLAIADCTGHGVPGGFMSMLGISYLNEISTEEEQPAEMLNKLRDKVIESLKQSDESNSTKDGMDIALIMIDTEKMELYFSGAFNSLVLIRTHENSDAELIEYKGDKMPIGIYRKMQNNFTQQKIVLQKNDCLYMFTDGIIDQFGGEKGRKFMKKNLKNWLLENYMQPMKTQKTILTDVFNNWRSGIYEQTDDVLVAGIRI